MPKRLFDLNIEDILENWEVYHAIREIISNALDEQLLTSTSKIDIYKDDQGYWRIQDHGRGIKIEDFTMNENTEKLNGPPGIIGTFGVGLKDALATFSRNNVKVCLSSPYGKFRLIEAKKHGFENITTLHIEYDDVPLDVIGTDVALFGVKDEDIEKAKSLFLTFSPKKIIETTQYGQVIEREKETAHIYINGVLANDEPNFLFSYNINNLTDFMRKRLNREKLNVGRATYTDRIKSILRAATSKYIKDKLALQVNYRTVGIQCEEMQWLEISQLAFTYLSEGQQVAYITENELSQRPEIIDNLRRDGIKPIVINEIQKIKMIREAETGGPSLRTLQTYIKEYNRSFQYKFISIEDLEDYEKRVYNLAPKIFNLIGLHDVSIPKIRISETMRLTSNNINGIWDTQLNVIIILRRSLKHPDEFAGTIIHEFIHSKTPFPDVSREFENELTDYLGKLAITALRNSGEYL